MTDDFEIEPGQWFSAWLRSEIASNALFEKNGFIPEQARAVAARLQADRPPSERYEVEVPWLRAFNAFTAPGKYIYFSRRLLERCPDEHTVAFVLGHEIAHHDLGHLRLFQGSFARHAARLQAGALAVLFFRYLQKRVYSPEWELAADRRSLDLCIAAGFEPAKCLRFFHIIELIYLDYGNLDAVYGLDPDSDAALSPEASLVTKARIWLWQRQHGYLPVQDRRAEAQRYLASHYSGAIQVRAAGV